MPSEQTNNPTYDPDKIKLREMQLIARQEDIEQIDIDEKIDKIKPILITLPVDSPANRMLKKEFDNLRAGRGKLTKEQNELQENSSSAEIKIKEIEDTILGQK